MVRAHFLSPVNCFSVDDARRGFILSLRASASYSPDYIARLEICTRQMGDFANEHDWPDVSLLTTAHLEEYLAYLQDRPFAFGEKGRGRLSRSSVETAYRSLMRFFNWLKEGGELERNPMDLIPKPRLDETVVPTLSDQDWSILFKALDPRLSRGELEKFLATRNTALLWLFADTPARRGEMAGIKRGDVDLDEGRVLVFGKGRKERWLALTKVPLAALADYLRLRDRVAQRKGPLWVTYRGARMDPKGQWIHSLFRRLAERAGLSGLHPHQFRHTYSVSALRGGMPERVLEVAGGWRKIPPTYLRTLDQEDAARIHRQVSPAVRLRRKRLA